MVDGSGADPDTGPRRTESFARFHRTMLPGH